MELSVVRNLRFYRDKAKDSPPKTDHITVVSTSDPIGVSTEHFGLNRCLIRGQIAVPN